MVSFPLKLYKNVHFGRSLFNIHKMSDFLTPKRSFYIQRLTSVKNIFPPNFGSQSDYRCMAAQSAASFVCLSACFANFCAQLLCIWHHHSCLSARSGHKGTLHPLPTLQNIEPVSQVLKQVVNLSCWSMLQLFGVFLHNTQLPTFEIKIPGVKTFKLLRP